MDKEGIVIKLIFLFLFPWILFASRDSVFDGSEDPSFFQHVHVISGQLNLSLQDAVVKGVASFPLTRTYLGDLEQNTDVELKDLRGGWLVEGGWHMLPHTSLLMVRGDTIRKSKIYLPEESGTIRTYFFAQEDFFGSIYYQDEDKEKTLSFDPRAKKITLKLPKGGLRIYENLGKDKDPAVSTCWHLTKEILSSKHQICYSYDEERRLVHVDLKNPSGSKTYSWVHFDVKNKGASPLLFEVKTSDQKYLRYSALLGEDGSYLKQVLSNGYREEELKYAKSEGSAFPRIHQMRWGDNTHFTAGYFSGSNKVQFLKASLGENKEQVPVAEFSYGREFTDVKDAKGLVVRYYHKDNKVIKIVYFDESGQENSRLEFFWKKNSLCAKVSYEKDKPVLSKTFSYDPQGRVIKETVWGNLTGSVLGTFFVQKDGSLEGAESISKFYAYDPKTGVLLYEKSAGISYKYSYKEGTDLIISKLTSNEDKILVREFFVYDEDHILVQEIIDDGLDESSQSTRGVTCRQIKKYEIHPDLGLPLKLREFYFDPVLQEEKLLYRIDYAYNDHFFVETEFIYDANEEYRYKIDYKYDVHNRRILSENRLQKKHHITSSLKECLRKTEKNGFLHQSFLETDSFIEYNLLKKPLRILHQDGTSSSYTYDKNGLLIRVLYPDQVSVSYEYDFLQRVTARILRDGSGCFIGEERWVYSSFHLLSYTDLRGLTRTFTYDGAGRRVSEDALGRRATYSYDSLGFLEKMVKGDVTFVQKRSLEGSLSETWEEKGDRKENHVQLFYNERGLLEKEQRITSKGIASYLFSYDKEGRVVEQIDPLGQVSTISYDEIAGRLRKTYTDSKGIKTVEETNLLHQVVLQEKQDAKGTILSREEFFYDDFGNKIKWVVNVYLGGQCKKVLVTLFEYDSVGRLVKQIEGEDKVTSFSYDNKGKLSTKTLPNKTTLFFFYDVLGRMIELKSSDSTIHYRYSYDRGMDPVFIADEIAKKTFYRRYNVFGEITEESSCSDKKMEFFYDVQGRRNKIGLPDGSFIDYLYSEGHLRSVIRKDASGELLYQHNYLEFDAVGCVIEESLIGGIGNMYTEHDLLQRASKQTSSWLCQDIEYGSTGLVLKSYSSLFGEKIYQYDLLDQLKVEGVVFDSLGNSSVHKVDDFNKILSSFDSLFSYDALGNPIKRQGSKETVTYRYDALGRLISIESLERKVEYSYDPFSRLISKTIFFCQDGAFQKQESFDFVYDGAKEIGMMNAKGVLTQLKVLGLGLKADVGATIAIELDQEIFAPLHDFYGNIIALVNMDGKIQEFYDIDPFGKESLVEVSSKNPWRFCSKRHEEGFVYFGARFYDPSTGRWLTPDPSGFADGLNLYGYVRNNPLNRLDIFGLSSVNRTGEGFSLQVEISAIFSQADILIPCKGIVESTLLDCYLASGCLDKIEYTEEEIESGYINLLDHFPEILPHEWNGIGLITFHNGINTTLEEFRDMSHSVIEKIPEGTLFIGMHTPTEGLVQDVLRFIWERQNYVTPIVFQTNRFMDAVVDKLHVVNPDLLWMDIRHSEGGVVGRRAIELLSEEKRAILQKKLYSVTIGSGMPIPRDYGLHVYNIYSEADYLTGTFGYFVDDFHHVKMVPCLSAWEDRVLFADHSFMSPTYQSVLEEEIESVRGSYGFHDTNSR